MVVFTAISSWLILVVLCTTGSVCSSQEIIPEKDNITCGSKYTGTNGTFHYSVGSSINVPENVKNCTWNIVSPSKNPVFLVFQHLYLLEGDTIHISANGTPLDYFNPIDLTNVTGALPCLTGMTNITVTLSTTSAKPSQFMRTLVMEYNNNNDCNHNFSTSRSGQIRSPLYDPNGSAVPTTCSLKVSVQDKRLNKMNLWFEKFGFSIGNVSISGSASHDGLYSATNIPFVEFLANDTLEMQISLPKTASKETESFVARYDSVSRVCSEYVKVTDKDVTIQSPPPDVLQYLLATDDQQMSCSWLVETESGKSLSASISNTTLLGALDQLLILDGPNRASPVLYEMSQHNHENLQAVFSNGSSLFVSVVAPFVTTDFMVDLQIGVTKSGGHMRDKGEVKTSAGEDRTVFLLEVGSGKQVQLVLNNSTVLKDSGTVSFYQDFLATSQPFLTMSSAMKKMDVVESPTAQMAVVTSGFKTSALGGSFSGIDEGCFKYGEGSSGTFSVSGHCNSSCGWMVQPMPSNTGLMAFHFQTVGLSDNDQVIIRMMDANQTQIANISTRTSHLPDLWLPAATGAFVQVTRSNCTPNSTVIQSNYQVTPKCAVTYTPGLDETISISTAGYPNHYPLGDSCTWDVIKPNGSSFLHLSFVDLQLAKEDHVLGVYQVNGTQVTQLFKANGTNKDLPMDMIIMGNLTINFTTKAQMPLHSMPGFNLTVSIIGGGGQLFNSTGEIETPGYPKPVNESALYVWFVQVNSTDTQQEIVEFSFANGTSPSDLEKNLKIYDGGSLRSGAIFNFTNSTLLSRTNQLIFVYLSTGSTPGPAFSVSYHNHSCNMSQMCLNHVCMHDDWQCNGINDCGDFSDERNCKGGTAPSPAPAPTPAPAPSDGSKGVSTAALAVGILIALVIGAILGFGAPTAFRRLRDNRFQRYSSFTNNIE